MATIRIFFLTLISVISLNLLAQTSEYEAKKNKKLKQPSPFEAIIAKDDPLEIVYQNKYVVAFVPNRKQAPIHLLIVPKKRINTLNDIEESDAKMLSSMMLAAKKLAKQYNIDKTGYRLAINTNEDAGQSVFHLHMHLLGGMPLGPAAQQTYKE
jgi:histidine triad (HIT) family protein